MVSIPAPLVTMRLQIQIEHPVILLHQNFDGSWGSGQWGDEPICTAWAILTLCKKVIPGIDYIDVDHMRIEFDTRPSRDRIKIFQARFQLDEGAS
jgi:hypothetical protein